MPPSSAGPFYRILSHLTNSSVRVLESDRIVHHFLDIFSFALLIISYDFAGMNLWIILLIILLAVALYYAKDNGYIPL